MIEGATATTHGARDHARGMAGRRAEAMPILPAADWSATPPPAGVATDDLIWAETVAGGGYTSKVIAAGTQLRLTDLTGAACANVLLYHHLATWERLNVADTTKVAWQAYLGAGHQLLSDQGRVLATITADTSTRHDAFCGTSSALANTERYGSGAPHGHTPAGRELFILAAAKHGLSPRDLPSSVSFFQGVTVEPTGALSFTGSAGAGGSVTLRAELPLVVLIVNVPHPLDTSPDYHCGPLEILGWRGEPTGRSDPLWSRTPEGERAYLNTESYLAASRSQVGQVDH